MALLAPFVVVLMTFFSFAKAISITSTRYYNISNDVEGSVHLNGLAFQQSALTTFGNYQYVAFYRTASGYGKHFISLGRRLIAPSLGEWQYFTFTDYEQKTLDEHNTISMGVSGDGRIHLSFDHHDVPLNYRVSSSGIAKTIPSDWSLKSFGGTVQHSLPGSSGPWYVTLVYKIRSEIVLICAPYLKGAIDLSSFRTPSKRRSAHGISYRSIWRW
jgi:hypothetical protein